MEKKNDFQLNEGNEVLSSTESSTLSIEEKFEMLILDNQQENSYDLNLNSSGQILIAATGGSGSTDGGSSTGACKGCASCASTGGGA